MSQENVEVVQAAWAAWERNGLAGFTEYWADDIDWRAIGGRWRGKDAGRVYLQELLGSFDEVKAEPIEFIDARRPACHHSPAVQRTREANRD